MAHLLVWLILLPAASALLCLSNKQWGRAIAVMGALITLVLAGWGLTRLQEAPSLRAQWSAKGGLLEQSIDRALARDGHGPDGVLRAKFKAILQRGLPRRERADQIGAELAGVEGAISDLATLEALDPPEPKRVKAAEVRLERARRDATALSRTLLRLESELAGLRGAAATPLADGFRFVFHRPWIPGLGNQIFLAVDGLSMVLVGLAALLGFLCVVASAGGGSSQAEAAARRCALLLLGEAGLIGTFCALDLILFFCCWVLVLFPPWFLFAGGRESEGAQAAARFFLPAFVGALLMLLAFLVLGLQGQLQSFNLLDLIARARAGDIPVSVQGPLFVCLALGCLVRTPTFPLHGWLPTATAHLPPAGTAFLQGGLTAAGAYGLLRLAWPLCPSIVVRPEVVLTVATVGLLSLLAGGLLAITQTDPRRAVAYASVSGTGYVLFGLSALTPAALTGAALEVVCLGLAGAGAALAAGILVERTEEPDRGVLGGLIEPLPRLAGVTALLLLALLGFPGLIGFVSKLLILIGAWASPVLPRWLTAVALAGVVLSAVGLPWTFVRVYMGDQLPPRFARLADLSTVEGMALIPIVAACVLLGLAPTAAVDLLGPAVEAFLSALPAAG